MNVPRESEVRPEFRAHLEWQIASALRREERFAAPVAAPWTRLRTAVALAAALACGAAAVAATDELHEVRQRDALVEAAKAEEKLNQLRVELARTAVQQARSRFEVGTASRETVQAAEAELRAMEGALARNALNIAEIQATAQPPRDDLQAPLVGTRDFVSERLKLTLAELQHQLAAAEGARAAAQARFEVGLASQAARMQAQGEVVQLTLKLQQMAATLELRKQALSGAIKHEDLVQQLRRLELTTQRQQIEREIEMLRARLQEIRRRTEVGTGGELELKRAELELLERQVNLQRIIQEFQKVTAGRR
jgi:hypothetical protein